MLCRAFPAAHGTKGCAGPQYGHARLRRNTDTRQRSAHHPSKPSAGRRATQRATPPSATSSPACRPPTIAEDVVGSRSCHVPPLPRSAFTLLRRAPHKICRRDSHKKQTHHSRAGLSGAQKMLQTGITACFRTGLLAEALRLEVSEAKCPHGPTRQQNNRRNLPSA